MNSSLSPIEIIAFILIALSSLLSLYRLLAGPSNADRIISADALSLITTITLLLLALAFESPLYLDIALVYAVLSFVGIIAIAKVVEPKGPTTIEQNIKNEQLNKDDESCI